MREMKRRGRDKSDTVEERRKANRNTRVIVISDFLVSVLNTWAIGIERKRGERKEGDKPTMSTNRTETEG